MHKLKSTKMPKVPKVGVEGGPRVAELLATVPGIEVLHDRLLPSSRANIDHVVVGPAGVFVVDVKRCHGAVEVLNVGGLVRLDERLYVHRHDRTSLVEGVLVRVEIVSAALAEEHPGVPVRGMLCLTGGTWGPIMRTKHLKGVTALWPKALPDQVRADGPHAEQVPAIAQCLRSLLRPGS